MPRGAPVCIRAGLVRLDRRMEIGIRISKAAAPLSSLPPPPPPPPNLMGGGRPGRRISASGRLLAGVLAGLLASTAAHANPTDPTVVHGSAQLARPGANALDVTTSPNAVIHWKGFSIGAGETTRFLQPSASSAVLNRVTGADPSAILGRLLSNGRVFLVNPHGIVFGEGAVVDTAGLVASTLGITDADFLAGRYRFDAAPRRRGRRQPGPDRGRRGRGLPARAERREPRRGPHRGRRSGARRGAARHPDEPGPRRGAGGRVQAPEGEALNLGSLVAERGAAGMFARSVRNTGTVEANAVTRDEHGTVRLVARDDLTLEAGGRVAAGGPSGGEVHVESETGTAWVSGEVSARGREGRGGRIRLLGKRVGLAGARGRRLRLHRRRRGAGRRRRERAGADADRGGGLRLGGLDRLRRCARLRRRRQGGGVRPGLRERPGPVERPRRPGRRRRRLRRDLGPRVVRDPPHAGRRRPRGQGRPLAHRPPRHRDRGRQRQHQHPPPPTPSPAPATARSSASTSSSPRSRAARA